MKETIYIKLLGEGTLVYRPVPATKIDEITYKIEGDEIHDPDDEEWEFLPKSIVHVEEKELEGNIVLVAINQKKS